MGTMLRREPKKIYIHQFKSTLVFFHCRLTLPSNSLLLRGLTAKQNRISPKLEMQTPIDFCNYLTTALKR